MRSGSERTTADEPVSDIDPGGSRPTKPGKQMPRKAHQTEQPVRSADQNQSPGKPERF